MPSIVPAVAVMIDMQITRTPSTVLAAYHSVWVFGIALVHRQPMMSETQTAILFLDPLSFFGEIVVGGDCE
jgi:hypothetical protein